MELGDVPSPSSWEGLQGPSAQDDPKSKCSGSTLRSLRVQISGIPSLGTRVTSPRISELALKDKNNFQNIAGPSTPKIELHSCPQVEGARHSNPNPAKPGSVPRVCTCREYGMAQQIITIGFGGVSIYTTQHPISHSM